MKIDDQFPTLLKKQFHCCLLLSNYIFSVSKIHFSTIGLIPIQPKKMDFCSKIKFFIHFLWIFYVIEVSFHWVLHWCLTGRIISSTTTLGKRFVQTICPNKRWSELRRRRPTDPWFGQSVGMRRYLQPKPWLSLSSVL